MKGVFRRNRGTNGRRCAAPYMHYFAPGAAPRVVAYRRRLTRFPLIRYWLIAETGAKTHRAPINRELLRNISATRGATAVPLGVQKQIRARGEYVFDAARVFVARRETLHGFGEALRQLGIRPLCRAALSRGTVRRQPRRLGH